MPFLCLVILYHAIPAQYPTIPHYTLLCLDNAKRHFAMHCRCLTAPDFTIFRRCFATRRPALPSPCQALPFLCRTKRRDTMPKLYLASPICTFTVPNRASQYIAYAIQRYATHRFTFAEQCFAIYCLCSTMHHSASPYFAFAIQRHAPLRLFFAAQFFTMPVLYETARHKTMPLHH
jgi:hypothetical protein